MNTPTDGEVVKKFIEMRDFLKAKQDALENGDPVFAKLLHEAKHAVTDGDLAGICSQLVDHLQWLATGTAPYVEAMSAMEGLMAIRLQERGDQSIKTEYGTVYQSTTLSHRVVDRESFLDFVKTADAFELLAANIAKEALKEHIEEHQGSPPPGVEIAWIKKTLFRRS